MNETQKKISAAQKRRIDLKKFMRRMIPTQMEEEKPIGREFSH